MVAAAEEGAVDVTRRESNGMAAPHDRDGDGRADAAPMVVVAPDGLHGITIRQGRLYRATPTQVFAADRRPEGPVATAQRRLDGLPDGGQHPTHTLAFGPDGRRSSSVGSRCNACLETTREQAAILPTRPDAPKASVPFPVTASLG
jgi:glucose/arabinose dehydrogenase